MAYQRIRGPLGNQFVDIVHAASRAQYRNSKRQRSSDPTVSIDDMLLFPPPKRIRQQSVKTQIAAARMVDKVARGTNGRTKSTPKSGD